MTIVFHTSEFIVADRIQSSPMGGSTVDKILVTPVDGVYSVIAGDAGIEYQYLQAIAECVDYDELLAKTIEFADDHRLKTVHDKANTLIRIWSRYGDCHDVQLRKEGAYVYTAPNHVEGCGKYSVHHAVRLMPFLPYDTFVGKNADNYSYLYARAILLEFLRNDNHIASNICDYNTEYFEIADADGRRLLSFDDAARRLEDYLNQSLQIVVR